MFCKFCGKQIETTDVVCPYCGKERNQLEEVAQVSGITNSGMDTSNIKMSMSETVRNEAHMTGNAAGPVASGNRSGDSSAESEKNREMTRRQMEKLYDMNRKLDARFKKWKNLSIITAAVLLVLILVGTVLNSVKIGNLTEKYTKLQDNYNTMQDDYHNVQKQIEENYSDGSETPADAGSEAPADAGSEAPVDAGNETSADAVGEAPVNDSSDARFGELQGNLDSLQNTVADLSTRVENLETESEVPTEQEYSELKKE